MTIWGPLTRSALLFLTIWGALDSSTLCFSTPPTVDSLVLIPPHHPPPNPCCREETLSQRHFQSEWGFLLPDPAKREVRPALDGLLCKYFNPLGGTWTVKEKKVPVTGRDPNEADEPMNPKSAAGVAKNTHATLMNAIPSNTAFITSNKQYGNRKSLEQFGVQEFGVRSTITKLPSN
jgi:hypothetical protein